MQPPNRAVSRRFLLMAALLGILCCAALAQTLPPISPPTSPNKTSEPPPGLRTLSMLGNVSAPGITTVLGTVTGKVMLDNGAPAVGFTVRAIPASLTWTRYQEDRTNTAVTDSDGRYTITLRPMNIMVYSGPMPTKAKGYQVFVSNTGTEYVEPPPQNADPDTQPNHIVTDVNFVMQIGPQIVVRVHDAITGAPVPGLKIHVDNDARDQVTGSDGTLRFRVPFTNIRLEADVPEDQQHALEFAPGYGGGEQTYKEATGVPGKDFVWDLKTYGATDKSDWHGIVLGPDGRPAAGVPVSILRANYTGGTSLITDAYGRFSAHLYRFDYGETGNPSDYSPVVYARHGSLAAAQVVTPDESWDGMTLHLTPGASVSGIVTDLKGNPAAGVGVSVDGMILGVYNVDSGQPRPALPQAAVTNKQGFFTLSGLPPGKYQVHVSGRGYGNLAFPAPVSSPTTMVQPRLALTVGERKYMGTLRVPHADKVLTGKVVDTHGQPAQGLFVRVTGAHTNQTAATQTDGTFQVYGVVDEPVTVEVGVPDHEATAKVAPGQTTVRLIAAPDVVATNGLGTSQ